MCGEWPPPFKGASEHLYINEGSESAHNSSNLVYSWKEREKNNKVLGSSSAYYLLYYLLMDTWARYMCMLMCICALFNDMFCLISLLHSGGFFINVTYSSAPNMHRFPPQLLVPLANLNQSSTSITSLSCTNVTTLGEGSHCQGNVQYLLGYYLSVSSLLHPYPLIYTSLGQWHPELNNLTLLVQGI